MQPSDQTINLQVAIPAPQGVFVWSLAGTLQCTPVCAPMTAEEVIELLHTAAFAIEQRINEHPIDSVKEHGA